MAQRLTIPPSIPRPYRNFIDDYTVSCDSWLLLCSSLQLTGTMVAESKDSTLEYQSPLMDTILSRFHSPPISTTYLSTILLNTVFPSPSSSSRWTFSERFPHQISIRIPSLLCSSHIAAHRSLFDFTIQQ
jgi:hypothetical protein